PDYVDDEQVTNAGGCVSGGCREDPHARGHELGSLSDTCHLDYRLRLDRREDLAEIEPHDSIAGCEDEGRREGSRMLVEHVKDPTERDVLALRSGSVDHGGTGQQKHEERYSTSEGLE